MHLSHHGCYLGTTDAASTNGLALQQAQFAAAACPTRTLEIARAIVIAKLKNQYIMIKRSLRSRPTTGLQPHLDALRHMRAQCQHVNSLEALRGCEGFAARHSYFAALRCILPAKWQFEQRTRPPQDAINALLSLGYTLLFQNVRSLLQARGLHTHLGFLHASRPGHPALASDMMEEFRAPVVDALVLDLCLSGRLTQQDFTKNNAGCRLQPEALKKFIHALEGKLQSPAQSGDGKPLHYRQAIEQQTYRLAAHLHQRHTKYLGYCIR